MPIYHSGSISHADRTKVDSTDQRDAARNMG
jgi:hypothetical protein